MNIHKASLEIKMTEKNLKKDKPQKTSKVEQREREKK